MHQNDNFKSKIKIQKRKTIQLKFWLKFFCSIRLLCDLINWWLRALNATINFRSGKCGTHTHTRQASLADFSSELTNTVGSAYVFQWILFSLFSLSFVFSFGFSFFFFDRRSPLALSPSVCVCNVCIFRVLFCLSLLLV